MKRTNFEKTIENKEPVTMLQGLRLFFQESEDMVEKYPEYTYAVLVMDIDQFKAVNSFCGREAGDDLLKFISSIFTEYNSKRPLCCTAHARADIFVLCTAYNDESELSDIAEDIYNRISSYPLSYKVIPSFGICCENENYNYEKPFVSGLKDCATMALQKIKGKFYSRYAFFDEGMRNNMLNEKNVQNNIFHALENDELKLFVQPKVDMRTGRIYGGESLVRWVQPHMGFVQPGSFIPILEKNGLIIQVDYIVWEKVFIFLHKLDTEGRELFPISINISRLHVYDSELSKKLIGFSKKYNVDPKYVPLELTESTLSNEINDSNIIDMITKLRKYGFKISMDDYGTGYSSTQLLVSLPLDEIKIDRSFVLNLDSPKGRIVLSHTIDMLIDLDIDFIIEGVETEEQKDFLIKSKCYKCQGFLFYKPMPIEEFDKLI